MDLLMIVGVIAVAWGALVTLALALAAVAGRADRREERLVDPVAVELPRRRPVRARRQRAGAARPGHAGMRTAIH